MALPMMRRITSPTPMGRTPGHDLQMSFDVDLNDVRMRLHSFASNPEGPRLPCVFMADLRIADALMRSNIEW